VSPSVAEVEPGAGALGLGSEKGALTKIFRPFSADNRPKTIFAHKANDLTRGRWRKSFAHKAKDLTELGEHRPSLRRGEAVWRPLLLKPIQEPEPLSSARKKERWQKKEEHPPVQC
jgi:hypothetical protein